MASPYENRGGPRGLYDSWSPDSARDGHATTGYKVISRHPRVCEADLRETGNLLREAGFQAAVGPLLAQRVFGSQMRRDALAVKNSYALVESRGKLLDRSIREIDETRNEVINRLSFARRPYSGRTAQEITRIEKMLFDIESDRRKEYLDFWKDLASERKELLEFAGEYHATRDRASLFGGPGQDDA